MPQGWRFTHPGDPPPRWGLSKTGRLVIAVTVAVGVVIALMIIVARPAGASDDAAGDGVEMPEYGFAVTVPQNRQALRMVWSSPPGRGPSGP